MVRAQKIGTQTGIVATKKNLIALDPTHETGYTNQAATLDALVVGHNEGLDRLGELETKLATLPFLSTRASG